MRTKDEYIESLAAELKEWSAQIDLLADKAEIVACSAPQPILATLVRIPNHSKSIGQPAVMCGAV
jgi:hypothetical protein